MLPGDGVPGDDDEPKEVKTERQRLKGVGAGDRI
jgi:hypothetical protein